MNKRTNAPSFRELKAGSFVYALDHALSPEMCRNMIERFEQNPELQYASRIGQTENLERTIKRSTDLRISGRTEWKDIDNALQQSLNHALGLLSGLHPFFQTNPLNDIGYNLQKTEAGEFYHWHVDGGGLVNLASANLSRFGT